MRSRTVVTAILAATAAGLHAPHVQASDRPFTYTYGSNVQLEGAFELEPWTTFRVGRDDFYNRLDHRLEFEVGLTDRLQTAWYLNFTALTKDEGTERVSELEWSGVSWEWKYELVDAATNPVGVGLYLEPGIGPEEAEIEAKLILDKRMGKLYAAANAVFEHEWEFGERGAPEREIVLELDLGATYFITKALSAGIEVRNLNAFPAGEGWAHSAVFAGPAIAYSVGTWWAALSVLPQLPALKKNDTGSTFVLDDHERFNARLIFGVHL